MGGLFCFLGFCCHPTKRMVAAAATAAKSLQSCPTLCDPIDSSPPGFPAPGILQARTLEWVAIYLPLWDEFRSTGDRERDGVRERETERGRESGCVFPFWSVSSQPFFWKQSGVIESVWPFRVGSVGVMRSAAVRRGWGKQLCRSLEGRSSFLKKKTDRDQEGRLWGKGSFAVGSLCCLEKKKTLPRLSTQPGMTTTVCVGKIRKGKPCWAAQAFRCKSWVDSAPVLEGPCCKPSCGSLSRLTSL